MALHRHQGTTSLSTDDLLALVEMGSELAAVLDLRALLPSILARACELTTSPDGSVILFDHGRGDLYFAAATGADAERLLATWGPRRTHGIPVDGSKAGQVFTTRQSLNVAALVDDEEHFKGVDAETRRTTRSMICVPLVAGSDCLGVMQVLNKAEGNYSERDITLLEHFATQAAVALRNARLVEDVLAHMGWYSSDDGASDPATVLKSLRQPAQSEELTVMFADMRGYNRLCQVLDRPEHMQAILNEFLTELASSVLARNGIVNKFLGDGLLALFRGAGAAERAVRCALDLTDRMPEMRAQWDASTNATLEFLDIGIGIATDTVILGSIGTARVRDFTALGTGVNLAAHLTRDARQGRRILVDKRTFRSVSAIVAADGPEEFELKKPDQPEGRRYERYCIRGLKGSPSQADVGAFRGVGTGAKADRRALAREDVFISYSHNDREWLEKLQTHLRPLVRGRKIEVWDDTRIKPGMEWKQEITRALARARVAVLLVSPNFLASDFIADEEWPALLEASRNEGLTVLWFALSACSYDETEIKQYQAALEPKFPIDSLTPAEQSRAFVTVCKEIGRILRSE